jgi:hypothetical protein
MNSDIIEISEISDLDLNSEWDKPTKSTNFGGLL